MYGSMGEIQIKARQHREEYFCYCCLTIFILEQEGGLGFFRGFFVWCCLVWCFVCGVVFFFTQDRLAQLILINSVL